MATKKPIAGVTYNTPARLKELLTLWYKEGLISVGAFISHKGETLEGELRKDHIHLYLEPAKTIEPMQLVNESLEPDPMSDKFLKILKLDNSKFDDWLLYSLHDPAYLTEKGLEKQFHYSLDEVWTTDQDTFNYMVSKVSETRKTGMLENRMVQMIKNGMTWAQILHSGLVPMRFIYPAKIIYDSLKPALDQEKLENSEVDTEERS